MTCSEVRFNKGDHDGRFIPYGIFKDLGLKTLVLYQFESDLHHRF